MTSTKFRKKDFEKQPTERLTVTTLRTVDDTYIDLEVPRSFLRITHFLMFTLGIRRSQRSVVETEKLVP